MKAAVVRDAGKVSVEEIDVPQPGATMDQY